MNMPAFLSPYLDGSSSKRLAQGLAAGAVATIVVGFGWGGWQLNGTVEKRVDAAAQMATVAALAPICADRFEKAANIDDTLILQLELVQSWQRDSHLIKGGWATFAGGIDPDSDVANSCANLLNESFKLN